MIETYLTIMCSIKYVLCGMNKNSNEFRDLCMLLDCTRFAFKVAGDAEEADIDALLKGFRMCSKLRVSIDDLYVYFHNLGVFKSE